MGVRVDVRLCVLDRAGVGRNGRFSIQMICPCVGWPLFRKVTTQFSGSLQLSFSVTPASLRSLGDIAFRRAEAA